MKWSHYLWKGRKCWYFLPVYLTVITVHWNKLKFKVKCFPLPHKGVYFVKAIENFLLPCSFHLEVSQNQLISLKSKDKIKSLDCAKDDFCHLSIFHFLQLLQILPCIFCFKSITFFFPLSVILSHSLLLKFRPCRNISSVILHTCGYPRI